MQGQSQDDGYGFAARLRCTNCGMKFTTPSDGDGIKFDGVREHGKNHHEDESWNYEIETYEIANDD